MILIVFHIYPFFFDAKNFVSSLADGNIGTLLMQSAHHVHGV